MTTIFPDIPLTWYERGPLDRHLHLGYIVYYFLCVPTMVTDRLEIFQIDIFKPNFSQYRIRPSEHRPVQN